MSERTTTADLPSPTDDGAAEHLTGRAMPGLTLPATDGGSVGRDPDRPTPTGQRWCISGG